jgi:hypothetical protein
MRLMGRSLASAQDHSSRLLEALLAEALSPAEDVMPAEPERSPRSDEANVIGFEGAATA